MLWDSVQWVYWNFKCCFSFHSEKHLEQIVPITYTHIHIHKYINIIEGIPRKCSQRRQRGEKWKKSCCQSAKRYVKVLRVVCIVILVVCHPHSQPNNCCKALLLESFCVIIHKLSVSKLSYRRLLQVDVTTFIIHFGSTAENFRRLLVNLSK